MLENFFPVTQEGFGSGDDHLALCHLHRQDAEARGIVVGHDVSDDGKIDLQRIDVEILEADAARKPFSQHILIQCFVRRKQRFPVLSGNGYERMNVLALTATLINHRIGSSPAD